MRHGEERGILTAQDKVAAAVRELSEIPVESPIADAGRDQTTATFEAEATVILDGSGRVASEAATSSAIDGSAGRSGAAVAARRVNGAPKCLELGATG